MLETGLQKAKMLYFSLDKIMKLRLEKGLLNEFNKETSLNDFWFALLLSLSLQRIILLIVREIPLSLSSLLIISLSLM